MPYIIIGIKLEIWGEEREARREFRMGWGNVMEFEFQRRVFVKYEQLKALWILGVD
jgi:hypothetical protein